LNALKTMDIERRNAGRNGIDIILSGTNNSTGNGLGSFGVKKRANIAERMNATTGYLIE